MEAFVTGMQRHIADTDTLTRTGTLTKKEVFRWCLNCATFPKPNVGRSDYFEFGPTPNSKYYLVSNIYQTFTSYFTVSLCRVLLPGAPETEKSISIKVLFCMLDNRDRCHYSTQKVLADCESVETTFDRDVCITENSMFIRNKQVRIQCSLDVEEVMDEQQKKTLPLIPIRCDSALDLTSDLCALLESGHHSDVTLSLGEHEFKAHRSILAARSTVFAAMFDHDTLEKQQNRIEIVDMSSDTMCHLLRYLYTGETGELTTQDFLSLFVAADKYDLQKLKAHCSNCISPTISSQTALSVLILAYLHQDEVLKVAATDAVLSNALNVMKSDEWIAFLKEYSELANTVILKLALNSQHK